MNDESEEYNSLKVSEEEFKEDPTMAYALDYQVVDDLKKYMAMSMAFSFIPMFFSGLYYITGRHQSVAWLLLGSYLGLFWVPALVYGILDRSEKNDMGKIKKVEVTDD